MPLQQLSVSAVLPIAGNLRQIAGEALQAAGGFFDGLLKLSEAIALKHGLRALGLLLRIAPFHLF